MKNNIIYILMLVGLPLATQAQDGWENDGEIEDVEIEIVKDREITLPAANRNFEKIPPASTTTKRENIEYFFNNINFTLPDLNVRMRPLKIKDERLQKLYGNYIKAGFGNFVTPYLEGYFNNKRSKDYSYGAHFNYLNSKKGPVDDENSGSGSLDLDVFGKYFTKAVTLSGDIGYSRRNYHFYGYPDGAEINDEDSIKQYFNNFYLKGKLESSNKKAPFQYALEAQVDLLKDNYVAKENEVQFAGYGKYKFDKNTFVRVDADLALMNRKFTIFDEEKTQNRNLFRLKPIVGFKYEDFKLEAGFNVVVENDTLGSADKLHFYPMAKATYGLTESIDVYAGIRGDVQKNTLRSISMENPYIMDNVPVFNANKSFDLYGGINAKVNNRMGVEAGISIANYKNMYFFVNDSIDQSRFDILYDKGNTAVVNLFGQMSYNTSDKFRLTARGDYWGYGTDGIDEAWHKPNYKITAMATYDLYDKFLFNLEAFTIGGITARGENNEAVSLDAAFDLNFKVDYLISDRFSVFLQFNNIFSKEYELYYRYPTRSLQFMAGLTYNF